MRVVGRKIGRAAREGREVRCGNTRTKLEDGATVVLLHGNPIVRVRHEGLWFRRVEVSLAGWPTVTTRSRINDVLVSLFGYEEWTPRVWQERHVQKVRDTRGVVSTFYSTEWLTVGAIDLSKAQGA